MDCYLFLSHAWRYHDEYTRLVSLLDNAPYFSWRNYSVPRHDPVIANSTTALKRELNDQIRPAQVVVVLAGVYASHSGWIQYEIDRALSTKKPIVGVVPWGQQRTSTAVSKAADVMISWNTTSIVRAIRDHRRR